MKTSWILSLSALLLLAVGAYVGFRLLQAPPLPVGFLYGNGHIEGTEIRVAAELPGRVIDSAMEEGKTVARGDVLATLDAIASSEALRAASAESAAIEQELAALRAQRDSWRHHLETAEREQTRLQDLAGRHLVSRQQQDQAANAVSEARGQVARLTAGLDALQSRLTAATAQVVVAADRRGKVEVRAPRDGTVLIKAVQAGEYLQPGQVVAVLVDMRELELRVYVSERDLGRITLGNDARVQVDAFPGRYLDARVSRIDPQAQFTPREIHLPDERVRTVYGITLALANTDGRLKPGMPADAWIRWQKERAWPATLFVPGE